MLNSTLFQTIGGLLGVVYLFTFEAAYRAIFGFNTGAVEVAIGAVSTIAVGRAIASGVTNYAASRSIPALPMANLETGQPRPAASGEPVDSRGGH